MNESSKIDQHKEFDALALCAMEYMRKYANPHATFAATQTDAQLSYGEIATTYDRSIEREKQKGE